MRGEAKGEITRAVYDKTCRRTSRRKSASEGGLPAEVHLRELLRAGRRLEVRVFLEAENLGGHVRGEAPPQRVELLDALVVAHAFGSDAVLRARQFVHQPLEV